MTNWNMNEMPQGFYWFNEPEQYDWNEGLTIRTVPQTDFWQNTHYGFQRDNGHCLLTKVTADFSFSAQLQFEPQEVYDQCGIFVRIDAYNWLKASVEYENTAYSRLGSVVTNLGYSDWATTDISSNIEQMSYRVSKRGSDFLIESSPDGIVWSQMRIAHLHQPFAQIEVGIYACSPKDSSFICKVKQMALHDNQWQTEH